MFKIYIKKCYVRRTCSSETKQNFSISDVSYAGLRDVQEVMVGFEPSIFRCTSGDVNE